jgi:hypothetical protein
MPAQNIIGKFGKGEIFTVLPPGFYTFIVVYSCYTVTGLPKNELTSLWMIIHKLSTDIQNNPILLLLILFGSYLFGSIIRTVPVFLAEKTIPPHSANFPYPGILVDVLETMKNYKGTERDSAGKLPNIENGIPMDVFNYWKDLLCVNSIEGFDYYQTFEVRSRFFAGMIWAGWFGIFGGIYVLISTPSIVWRVAFAILIISIGVLAAFGLNFRRVRKQEAKALLLILIAYLQK